MENLVNASYENIKVRCQHCGQESILNRASDLRNLKPISGQNVTCPACGVDFYITGDLINPAFEMFFYDCDELYKLKRYSLCITCLAQAWEVFFANFLRIELAYKPFFVHDDQERMNQDLGELFDTTKAATFNPLRNIFLQMLNNPGELKSVQQLRTNYKKWISRPEDIEKVAPAIRGFAQRLHKSELGRLRNQVVHKEAYRPSKEEVDTHSIETLETLFPLARALEVAGDDVNWYAYKFKKGVG